jgi:hypothetical protein
VGVAKTSEPDPTAASALVSARQSVNRPSLGTTPILVHNDDVLPTQLQGRNQPLTSKQATDLAKYLGYRDAGQRLKGQKIFTNGKAYISQDIGSGDGSHNGGTWKIANSIKALGSKASREAATDALLNPIGC